MGKRNQDVETQLENKRRRRWITAGLAVFFVLLAGLGAFALVWYTIVRPVAQPVLASGPSVEETLPIEESATSGATTAEETAEPTEEEAEPTEPPIQIQAQAILDGKRKSINCLLSAQRR